MSSLINDRRLDDGDSGEVGIAGGGTATGGGGGALVLGGASPLGVSKGSWGFRSDNSSSDCDPSL